MIDAKPAPARSPHYPAGFEVHALKGHLYLPHRARGLMVIPTVGYSTPGVVDWALDVALQEAEIGTCHVQLLDRGELADPRRVADVDFLVHRLTAVFEFLRARPRTRGLPLGLLGSHQMAAAVLATAARHSGRVRAVICHCGRDMAGIDMAGVQASVLFIVPARDEALVRANEEAFWQVDCPSQLAVVRGASRHFTEAGALLACQQLVGQWCRRHLNKRRPDRLAAKGESSPLDREKRPPVSKRERLG